MKTRHLALLIGAGMLAALTSFMLWQARAMVPQIASTYILITCILLALAAACILLWLTKNLYRHAMGIVSLHQEHTTKKYELTERQERWKLEQEERRAAIYLKMSRVNPGTYIMQPDMNLLPSQRDVILLPQAHARQIAGPGQGNTPSRQDDLPTEVLYEEIRGQIPRGHILIGIGRQGIETRDKAIGACVWIVGLSGTGKTSTTVLRVEERAADNHLLLGVDPHWFKDDSLYHAIYELEDKQTGETSPGPYADIFAMPMAKTPAESLQVLKTFLGEFYARKNGQRPKPWRRVTLLVDEVGAQMDKATATTPEEKEIIELLPSIARICGQEARNFGMGGIFISQQATGLAWLRKVALMIIVHQLLQESEKKLATNDDPVVMKAMKSWPIGRTYVYGVGFGTEGPRTVQQPYFKPGGYDAGEKLVPDHDYERHVAEDENEMEPLYYPGQEQPEEDEYNEEETTEPGGPDTDSLPIDEDLREALEACQAGATGPRDLERALNTTYYRARQLYQTLKDKGLVEAD